jgi:hypothetical protein
LQRYFFDNLNQRSEIDKPLLQHYLYVHFFEVIYKKYPDRIEALKTDRYLSYYIKLDYVALPNSLECPGFPADYRVRIEYADLPVGVPEMACQAIQCSQKSNEHWKRTLNLRLPTHKSDLTLRVADSYKKYPVTYAYGYAPTGSGFYISKQLINQTAYGEAYCYWGNDTHNFIEVTRHEAAHHDNYVFTTEAYRINAEIMSLTAKSPNEGLAVNGAGGPCAPGFVNQDFSNVTAPTVHNLLEESFIGYPRSWLYTNYLIQERPNFYRDILTLDKADFKDRWTPILNRDQQHFLDWLPYLKQACQDAPKELTLENCPSIFLKDYLPPTGLKATTISQRLPKQVTRQIASRTTTIVKISPMQRLSVKPDFYEDYFLLMHAISEKNITEMDRILNHTNYSITSIVNFRNPERRLETPLHYAFGVHGRNCSDLIIQKLCSFGALPNLIDAQNSTAYDMAKNCQNWPYIKTLCDNQIENLKKSTENRPETGVVIYQSKENNLIFTISIPITSFLSGVISTLWAEISIKYPYLTNPIFYGLRPISLALTSAAMNSLLAGPAESIGLEDAWLSFAYYLGMNYLGLMIAQMGEKTTKKIQNKILNLLLPVLLYTFFLNPSLIITFLSEGFGMQSMQAVMMPLLSMLGNGLFFKAGEWGAKKVARKFYSENSVEPANDSTNYFLRFSLDGTPKRISSDQETLENIQVKLKRFIVNFKKNINNQVYKLAFAKDIESTTANISILLEEISKDEREINREEYEKVFKEFEKVLVQIQEKLTKLLKNPKIQLLWKDVTEIVTNLRSIRSLPLLQVNNSPDLVENHGMRVTIEEEQTLLTTFTTPQYTPVPLGGRNYFFPPPPTEEQLLEMQEMQVIKGDYSPGIAYPPLG